MNPGNPQQINPYPSPMGMNTTPPPVTNDISQNSPISPSSSTPSPMPPATGMSPKPTSNIPPMQPPPVGPNLPPQSKVKLPSSRSKNKESHSHVMPIIISSIISLILVAAMMYVAYLFFLKTDMDDLNTKIENVQNEVNVLQNRLSEDQESTTSSTDSSSSTTDSTDTTTDGEKTELTSLFTDAADWETEDPVTTEPTTTCDDGRDRNTTNSLFALTYEATDDTELSTVHQDVLDVIQANDWTLCTTDAEDAYPTGSTGAQIYVKDSKLLYLDISASDTTGYEITLTFEYSE